jgi:ketosteroid isomerase-like protein
MKTVVRTILPVLLLLCSAAASAQTDQDEINRQVWHPFMKAYEKLDASMFMSLHSRELMRVELDMRKTMHYDAYAAYYQDFFNRFRKSGEKIRIRFSFTHRVSDGSRAFEKGYYEFTLHTAKGEARAYGSFTVMLKKEQDRWKIILDADTNKDMSEAVFLSGKILQ